MGFCSKGLKNEFETAMVNEPSVFEPLKFYYINILPPFISLCFGINRPSSEESAIRIGLIALSLEEGM